MAETMAYALTGPSGQPLAAMFTGPLADKMAGAWLIEVARCADQIKARAARRDPRRVGATRKQEAHRA